MKCNGCGEIVDYCTCIERLERQVDASGHETAVRIPLDRIAQTRAFGAFWKKHEAEIAARGYSPSPNGWVSPHDLARIVFEIATRK